MANESTIGITNSTKLKDVICRYIDGETYASIGSSYGVSRQAVEAVIKTFAASVLTGTRKKYTKMGAPEKSPFARKQLADWMKDQRYTVAMLAKETQISVAALYSFLNGRTCLRRCALAALANITGLTAEQLIERRDEA